MLTKPRVDVSSSKQSLSPERAAFLVALTLDSEERSLFLMVDRQFWIWQTGDTTRGANGFLIHVAMKALSSRPSTPARKRFETIPIQNEGRTVGRLHPVQPSPDVFWQEIQYASLHMMPASSSGSAPTADGGIRIPEAISRSPERHAVGLPISHRTIDLANSYFMAASCCSRSFSPWHGVARRVYG